MKQGSLTTKRQPWSEIVYSDMKADNVFLGLPDGSYYPQYPTPKLGDFGMAFPTNNKDDTNPVMWAGRGTRGHFAPEQQHWMSEYPKKSMNDDKMLSPCNVYGVATVMYQLMERKVNLSSTPKWRTKDNRTIHKSSAATLKLYGGMDDDLCDLVRKCLNSNPRRRPKLQDLLKVVNEELYDKDVAKYRQDGFVDDDGDTLLLPDQQVRLKWASRLRNGTEGVNATRLERAPATTSTVRPGASPPPVDRDPSGDTKMTS